MTQTRGKTVRLSVSYIQNNTEILVTTVRQKNPTNWNGKNKISLFTICMIIYIENFKGSYSFKKHFQETINEFNKFSGCAEINTQKSIAFLHTTMNVRKSNQKKVICLQLRQRKWNTLSCKSDKMCIRCIYLSQKPQNWWKKSRRSKEMKRHTIFIQIRNKHSKDVNSLSSSMGRITLFKNPAELFITINKFNLKCIWKAQILE